MHLASFVPALTVAEFNRPHLSPSDACRLAGIFLFDESEPAARKFLNNVSDRGHVPFTKSGEGKTAPRLYSAKASLILRAMHDMTAFQNRRTYEFVAPVAHAIAALAEDHIEKLPDLNDLDPPQRFCLYGSYGDDPRPEIITRAQFTPDHIIRGQDNSIYAADDLIWNVLRHYPDFWARDRLTRGMDMPPSIYDGCDENGEPLNIADPWYADLTPLERAKRLVEIEEFLAKEGHSDRPRSKKRP